MKQETRFETHSERSIPTKRWYYLNLFQKFALIFFCIVAIPVTLIALHVLYQSKYSILKSAAQVVDIVTTTMDVNSEMQQKANEALLERANQEFAQLSDSALTSLQDQFIQDKNELFKANSESLATEARQIIEDELQLLNSEVAQGIATLGEHFLRESELAMKGLAQDLDTIQLRAGSIKELWDILLSYEQFVYLDFVNTSGESMAPATKDVLSFQADDPIVTEREPYLTSALSGENIILSERAQNGMTFLRIFIPVKRRHNIIGVLFGVVSVQPFLEQMNARFFNHGEQIYLLDAYHSPVYPSQDAQIPQAIRDNLGKMRRIDESHGTLQNDEFILAFTTVERVQWKILVTQPRSSITTRLAPLETLIARYDNQVEAHLQSMTKEQVERIERELAIKIDVRKQENRQNILEQYTVLTEAIDQLVTENITLMAEDAHKQTLSSVVPMIIGLGSLAVIIGIFVAGKIIKPIKSMTGVAYEISQGNVSQTVPEIHSHDEIGRLSQIFHDITFYLWNLADGAQKISEGEFTSDVPPVSGKDALGLSFKRMTGYLRDVSRLASDISHGDLSQVVTPKSENDLLGNAVYRMTLYLQNIAQIAKTVAGGNLSETFDVQSEKDFLGNAFAEMILKLRHLVSKIRTGSNQLVTLSSETLRRAEEEAESVDKISLSVEETSSSMNEMALSINDVNERMKQFSSVVGETSSSIEELNSSIRQIVSHGEQLAIASEETSTSIQEISASLQQIADTAENSRLISERSRQDAMNGRDAVEKMIQSMNIIEQMVRVTADTIQHLNKRTESIEKILDVIKDISAQTSLLSINASIIAKKAGARGRGFNVIADRVRKLADQSNLSAKEIARIIRDVRKESAHAVEVVSMGREKVREGVQLAQSAGKALKQIISGTNESSSVVASIAETTQEQTKISHYIMESMEQVVEMVNQIKVATKEQEQSSAYIMTQAEQVLMLSQQVKQSTFEQTEVVKHVTLATDDIRVLIQMTSERAKESALSASTLSQHADALKNLVSQFTI